MQHMLPGSENGSYGFIRKNPRLFTFIKMKQPLGTNNNLDNNFWTTGVSYKYDFKVNAKNLAKSVGRVLWSVISKINAIKSVGFRTYEK